MFQDMGELPPELFETFRGQSRDKLHHMFARGDYIGWVVSLADEPERIVAGAGVQLREVPRIRKPTRTAKSTSSPAVRRSSKMFSLSRNGGVGD